MNNKVILSILSAIVAVVIGLYEQFKTPTISTPKTHHGKKNEKYYQTILCKELGGRMEYVLSDRTRVDCLTDSYAIEVDFAKKWAEAVGQSLYYALMTHRKPGIGLIVDRVKDRKYLKRIKKLTRKYHIKLYEIAK